VTETEQISSIMRCWRIARALKHKRRRSAEIDWRAAAAAIRMKMLVFTAADV
jgi:hypothetical protein